jgi:hypothetical protein
MSLIFKGFVSLQRYNMLGSPVISRAWDLENNNSW